MTLSRVESPALSAGVLITNPRDQTTIQPVLSDYAERAVDWPFNDQLRFLNRWAGIFKTRLLDPIAIPNRPKLPDPVIGFEPMRVETLAAYTLNRNPHGLLYEINFNEVHFVEVDGARQWRYGQWGLCEAQLHEMVHLWQQNFGLHPYKKGANTHNAEFVAKCEAFGLHPAPVVGYHILPADGIFAAIMREHGIARPEGDIPDGSNINWWLIFKDLFGEPPKGRSSLTKWECPGCGLKLRVGVKGDIEVACMPCSRTQGDTVLFRRAP